VRLGFGYHTGFFCLARSLSKNLSQAIQFFLQGLGRRSRIRRRHESARRKAAISKSAVKPDSELACDLEGS